MKPTTVEEYIQGLEKPQKEAVLAVRQALAAVLPGAQEVLSYGMPAFRYRTNLLYYAAWKKHLGLYPAGARLMGFEEALKPYVQSKGAIQFHYTLPMPLDLIQAIAVYRLDEYQRQEVRP